MVQKLAYLKRRNKLTTENISLRCGIPVGTLNKIFTGQTRSPSLAAMHGLCRVFNVPFCFLMEDDVPVDCSMMAYAERRGMFLMKESELSLFEQYRALNERDQNCVAQFIAQYAQQNARQGQSGLERLLPCYEPIAMGRQGLYADRWRTKTLRVPVDSASHDADFAVAVFSDELAPFYSEGDVLAVKNRTCMHGQLGLFLLNGELFLRRLNRKNGAVKLISLKSGNPTITVGPEDTITCLGLISGMIKHYEYL